MNNLIKAPLLLSLISLSLIACNGNSKKKDDDTTGYKKAYGLWERKGYGSLFDISKNGVESYEFTRNTCTKNNTISLTELEKIIPSDSLQLSENTQVFSAFIDPPFKSIYTRRNKLPENCSADKLIKKSSPTIVFEQFWHTFNDYYAFFNKRNINWQQQYDKYKPQIKDTMTDDELFSILSQALAPINDPHISLTSDTNYFQPHLEKLILAFIEEFQQQTESDNFSDYLNAKFEDIKNIQLSKLTNIHQAKNSFWGIINEDLAYLNISQMIGFSDIEDPSYKEDIDALNRIMSRALNDLKNTKALIIDVRLNGGGYDGVSVNIAGHFTNKTTTAMSKYTRSYLGNSTRVIAKLKPIAPYYNKPIAILASESSVSAAESFLMTMRSLSQVSIIGQRSAGAFSDILGKELANGWNLGLSNEVFFDSQGINYEGEGIPVDVSVNAFSLDDIAHGRDGALETAINYLGF